MQQEFWRYTEWDTERKICALFDHDTDPHELRNLAYDPSHVETVALLRMQLSSSPVATGKYSQRQP